MINISIKKEYFNTLSNRFAQFNLQKIVLGIAIIAAIIATIYSFIHGYIAVYGDAESHLNIAKRVVDSLTPGFAQLGGIWLPLPHLLLVPFVNFDILWRTGLAGSIVSGIAFAISALYLYKLVHLITNNKYASFFAALVFIFNPNVLYLQTTPMTEVPLLAFFILSTYYFILYIKDDQKTLNLIIAAFFGFCASLSRYDGWALVMMEAGILFLYYFPWHSFKERALKLKSWAKLEGRVIAYSTLAFFGIGLWLLWGFLILGDPLYFTHSQFSANSQQQSWLARGELPAYHNIALAIAYYFVTSVANIGVAVTLLALAGLGYFLWSKEKNKWFILLVLAVPFFFNIATLYIGQSVIFIPSLTPTTFEWTLFNVRYGVMMVPFAAFAAGYLFYKLGRAGKLVVFGLFLFQFVLFGVGYSDVISFKDGTVGLSSAVAKMPDAQQWIAREYDHGLILTDDFARTISIIRTPIPMENVIYIGNKPYWEESLDEPEKYARWIVMQKDDTVWTSILGRPEVEARLYKYFNKVYTSEEILIFRKID